MTYKKLIEDIQVLAMEEMTEDGIHHDDFPDLEHEYIPDILISIGKSFDIDLIEK